ncbi:MAG: XdhC/CoxF family protein [bacterium]|nr:XdhC/CoxF family protein [bacterium]
MADVIDAISGLNDAEKLGAVATIVDGPGFGNKAVLDAAGVVLAGSLPDNVISDVSADAVELMRNEQSRTLAYGERSVFIETVAPQPIMLLFGAGHIAQPLSVMAQVVGFRVIVADARATWATPERFPAVDRLVVGWPDVVLEEIELDSRTYVVMLSHDRRFEDPVLAAVRSAPVAYVGALGSRRTSRERGERLSGEGWSSEEIERLHAPIGIDIGAETPAEIAVSILGEITRVRYGAGSGLSLRGQAGRIHPQRGVEAGTE